MDLDVQSYQLRVPCMEVGPQNVQGHRQDDKCRANDELCQDNSGTTTVAKLLLLAQ